MTPITELVREIIVGRQSGRLTVISGETRRNTYWSQGELILALSSDPAESLGQFLAHKELVSKERASALTESSTEIIPQFDDFELPDRANRNSLLRSWTASIVQPLFSLESGTAVFVDEDPLEPSRRVFVSTASIVLEGTRGITSGLLLRTSLGDLKREIMVADDAPFGIATLPLTPQERAIAETLGRRLTIDAFLKSSRGESVLAARVTIAMMTLGVFTTIDPRLPQAGFDDTENDLAVLLAIGGDRRALQAVGLAKRLGNIDYYELLDIPRAATRSQILIHADEARAKYDPITYPPPAQTFAREIIERIETALKILSDADKRAAYDRALSAGSASTGASIQQKVVRRNLAMENFRKAEELFVKEDFYGAIVLLQQAVKFAPDHAKSWNLLGVCQQKNPRWRRNAVESFHRALSIDPNQIDTMIALGDLYASQMMKSRARSFYEDVLKVDSGHVVAKSRLKKLGK